MAAMEHQLLRSFGSSSSGGHPGQMESAATLLAAAANNSKRFSSSPQQMNQLSSLLNGASLSELTGHHMQGHGGQGLVNGSGSTSSPGLDPRSAGVGSGGGLSSGGSHANLLANSMNSGLSAPFNPYEKWSNGDSLFNLTPHQSQQQEQSFKVTNNNLYHIWNNTRHRWYEDLINNLYLEMLTSISINSSNTNIDRIILLLTLLLSYLCI
jgi:hypothetical protein